VGPALVFVHGAYVTGALWNDVIALLSPHYRCIAPTWPFGAQRRPVGDADLSVAASGRRIIGLLDALDLSEVTLVANDTGGGIVLAALGDSSLDFSRVARLVFTNCDSFEHFPPKSFAPLVRLCRFNPRLGAAMLHGLATRLGLKIFASAVTKHGLDSAHQSAIFGGFTTSGAVRGEAARFTADLQPSYTLTAVPALQAWTRPVLMAWGDDDTMFPLTHAQRLADAFPHGYVRAIDDSSTYVMLDQPNETASAIAAFVKAAAS
jgi:pimeloyl-ACP methyl ester carboxylesterase